MILKNNTPKGRYYTIVIEGIPQRIWVGGYQQYNLVNLSKEFENGEVINNPSLRRRITSSKSHNFNNYILLKGNGTSLINSLNRNQQIPNISLDKILDARKIPNETYYSLQFYSATMNLLEMDILEEYGDLSSFFSPDGIYKLYVNGVYTLAIEANAISSFNQASDISHQSYTEIDLQLTEEQYNSLPMEVLDSIAELTFTYSEPVPVAQPLGSYLINYFRIDSRFFGQFILNIYLDSSYGDITSELSLKGLFTVTSLYGHTESFTTTPPLITYTQGQTVLEFEYRNRQSAPIDVTTFFDNFYNYFNNTAWLKATGISSAYYDYGYIIDSISIGSPTKIYLNSIYGNVVPELNNIGLQITGYTVWDGLADSFDWGASSEVGFDTFSQKTYVSFASAGTQPAEGTLYLVQNYEIYNAFSYNYIIIPHSKTNLGSCDLNILLESSYGDISGYLLNKNINIFGDGILLVEALSALYSFDGVHTSINYQSELPLFNETPIAIAIQIQTAIQIPSNIHVNPIGL